jgi:hypothetical protein
LIGPAVPRSSLLLLQVTLAAQVTDDLLAIALHELPDGDLLITGNFSSIGGVAANGAARIGTQPVVLSAAPFAGTKVRRLVPLANGDLLGNLTFGLLHWPGQNPAVVFVLLAVLLSLWPVKKIFVKSVCLLAKFAKFPPAVWQPLVKLGIWNMKMCLWVMLAALVIWEFAPRFVVRP